MGGGAVARIEDAPHLVRIIDLASEGLLPVIWAQMAPEDPEIALNKARQKVVLRHDIEMDTARKIVKLVKESKLKLQSQIQGSQVRVSGKKRDALQDAIQMLKDAGLGLPLQFTNFRD